MGFLDFREPSNLQFSLIEFLESKLLNDSLDVQVVVGKNKKDNWKLPLIQVTFSSQLNPRLFLGNNAIDKQSLVICDIRADGNNWSEQDLSDWLLETLKDGFPFFEYESGGGDNPNKTQNGNVSLDFLTNQDASQGEDANDFDKYRWRISFRCWISNK